MRTRCDIGVSESASWAPCYAHSTPSCRTNSSRRNFQHAFGTMYGMPTTWFFDGAGTGREGGVIVLSGVGGSDAMWGRLNPLWNAALAKLGVPVRHSTDYFRSTGRKHRSVLPAMLLNLIGEQLVQEFNCVSFAADKRAIEMVNLQYPGTVPSLPKLLMRLCFRGLCASADDTQQKSRINVFFDR